MACTEYIDCSNQSLSTEDIIRKTITTDDEGCPAIRSTAVLKDVGNTVAIQVTLTRPADTAVYAAKDTVADSTSAATVLIFDGAGRINNGTGYITGCRFETDQAANVSAYKIHLFRSAPASVIEDNVAWTEDWDDRALRIGDIDIPALTNNGGASDTAKREIT